MKYFFYLGIISGIFSGILIQKDIKIVTRNYIDLTQISLKPFNDFDEIADVKFRNNTKLLYFWGSYCPYCVEKLPSLNKFAKFNPEIDLICISSEPIKTSKEYLSHFNFDNLKFYESSIEFSEMGILGIPLMILIQENNQTLLSSTDIKELLKYD